MWPFCCCLSDCWQRFVGFFFLDEIYLSEADLGQGRRNSSLPLLTGFMFYLQSHPHTHKWSLYWKTKTFFSLVVYDFVHINVISAFVDRLKHKKQHVKTCQHAVTSPCCWTSSSCGCKILADVYLFTSALMIHSINEKTENATYF